MSTRKSGRSIKKKFNAMPIRTNMDTPKRPQSNRASYETISRHLGMSRNDIARKIASARLRRMGGAGDSNQ